MQEESGLIGMLSEDFELSQELQQRLTVEGGAHASAIQELRDQVCVPPCVLQVSTDISPQVTFCAYKAAVT